MGQSAQATPSNLPCADLPGCCSSMASQLGLVLYPPTFTYSGEMKHCSKQPDLILQSRNHKLKQYDAHWVGAPLKLAMEPENKQRRYISKKGD